MTTAITPDLKPDHHRSRRVGQPLTEIRLHPTHDELDTYPFDPTQGRKIGSDPYDDPTQGRKIGSDPYDDPTRGR